MCRVIEIKLGAVGEPAHNVDPSPGANRFLGFSEKPETFYVSSCGLSKIGIVSTSYLLALLEIRMAIELDRWRGGVGFKESVLSTGEVYAGQKT